MHAAASEPPGLAAPVQTDKQGAGPLPARLTPVREHQASGTRQTEPFLLCAFLAEHRYPAKAKIQVFEVQAHDLLPAQRQIKEQPDNGPVPADLGVLPAFQDGQ